MEGNIWPMSSLCLLRPCICKKKIALLHFSENYVQIEVSNYWVYEAYMYKRDYARFQADSFVKNCLDDYVTFNMKSSAAYACIWK